MPKYSNRSAVSVPLLFIHIHAGFSNSRWFTRGWTLQKLIAPRTTEFYSNDWTVLGDKTSLATLISNVTGRPADLRGADQYSSAHAQSVAQRTCWASKRVTTRRCLMGIFGVNMPLLYGENAFQRLQEEILKKSDDQNLFAWRTPNAASYTPALAQFPSAFGNSTHVVPFTDTTQTTEAYSLTYSTSYS
jgi:hypothetical protein